MKAELVVVGTSLGGLAALRVLLSGLSRQFKPPVVIAQHRTKSVDDGLVNFLAVSARLPVSEPNDKDAIEAGHVYLAPADYHLFVERGSFALSTDAPVNYARPSIDVLFESAADSYGRGVIGVVLTGSNQDGAKGSARIKERGGVVLVQDGESSESNIMPAAAMAATTVDKVVPLSKVASTLADLCQERVAYE